MRRSLPPRHAHRSGARRGPRRSEAPPAGLRTVVGRSPRTQAAGARGSRFGPSRARRALASAALRPRLRSPSNSSTTLGGERVGLSSSRADPADSGATAASARLRSLLRKTAGFPQRVGADADGARDPPAHTSDMGGFADDLARELRPPLTAPRPSSRRTAASSAVGARGGTLRRRLPGGRRRPALRRRDSRGRSRGGSPDDLRGERSRRDVRARVSSRGALPARLCPDPRGTAADRDRRAPAVRDRLGVQEFSKPLRSAPPVNGNPWRSAAARQDLPPPGSAAREATP